METSRQVFILLNIAFVIVLDTNANANDTDLTATETQMGRLHLKRWQQQQCFLKIVWVRYLLKSLLPI